MNDLEETILRDFQKKIVIDEVQDINNDRINKLIHLGFNEQLEVIDFHKNELTKDKIKIVESIRNLIPNNILTTNMYLGIIDRYNDMFVDDVEYFKKYIDDDTLNRIYNFVEYELIKLTTNEYYTSHKIEICRYGDLLVPILEFIAGRLKLYIVI